MYNLITKPADSPLSAMGEALLRMSGRRRASEGRPPASDELRLFVSALFAAFAAADGKGSVCISLFYLARELAGENEEEGSLLNDSDVAELTSFIGARLDELREDGLVGSPEGAAPEDGSPGARHQAAPILLDGAEAERDSRLYFARAYEEEKGLAGALLTLASTPPRKLPAATKRLADALTAELGADRMQKKAVLSALEQTFCVICGGPGTGKTTTVVLILECLLAENPDLRIYLAAPTGKAASRMRQSVQAMTSGAHARHFPRMKLVADGSAAAGRGLVEERTIHKWLVTNTPAGRRPAPDNPLACDVLIIDEASMVDVHLAARLFSVVDPKTRVIVLGDKHQLAAVGPGAVFADMSDKKGALAKHVVELQTSRRFVEGSVIARLASAINHTTKSRRAADEVRAILAEPSDPTGRWVAQWHAEELSPQDGSGLPPSAVQWLTGHLSRYADALLAYLSAVDSDGDADTAWTALWQALQDFRPLCAQRRGPCSVEAVNAFAEDYVRTRLAEAGRLDQRLDALHYPGEVLIVRRNDDMLGVFNGDVGIVVPVKEAGEKKPVRTVVFGDSGRRIPPALLPSNDTAFAMTIHQSQGSEFRHVAVFLPTSAASGLATRELLYTGVTRTMGSVTIFGGEDVLRRSVETPTVRVSGLAERMTEQAARTDLRAKGEG